MGGIAIKLRIENTDEARIWIVEVNSPVRGVHLAC
jgi:hypothetical protein